MSPPPFTLQQVADQLGAKVHGDGSVLLRGIAPLTSAGEGDLTFLTSAKYAAAATVTRASAVILSDPVPEGLAKPLLVHPNPYACLARAIGLFHPAPEPSPGVRDGAFVDPSAQVHPTACVMPGAFVGARAKVGERSVIQPGAYVGEDAVVGSRCLLHPNSVVAWGCVLGDRVILQPGAVVGGDGFGFAPENGAYLKIPQVGNVVLEDDVEVGANSTVDRAVLGTTRVGRGTKLDNLVQVGHNCVIGVHTVIAAQTGLAGSATVGGHCVFGGQVGLAGHLRVGDSVTLATRTGVMEDIPGPGVYWGSPSSPFKEEMKNVAAYRELPQLVKRLRRIERALERLDPGFSRGAGGKA